MATITYTVTVATGTNQYGTGNKFYINGSVSPDLNLIEGNTYIFDQSDSTNATHILAFSTSANNSPAAPYTTGVTTTGTPGTDGKTTIVVATNAPTLVLLLHGPFWNGWRCIYTCSRFNIYNCKF